MEKRHNVGMGKKRQKTRIGPDSYDLECGERLRKVREALGYNRIRAFANATNVTEDALSSWERGVNGIPPKYIQSLKSKFGVTHEYIFSGDPSRLPPPIIEYIRKLAS